MTGAVLLSALVAGGASASAADSADYAFTDESLTTSVLADTTAALTAMLSVDWTDLAANERAVEQWATVGFRAKQDSLYQELRRQAPVQHYRADFVVREIGIKQLDERGARLLVFGDQHASRDGVPNAPVATMMGVVVERSGSTWKLADVTTVS